MTAPDDAPGRDAAGRPLRRALDVAADLRIELDGAPGAIRVTGDGPRLTVDVPDGRTALRLVRDGRALGGPRETLAALTGGLSEAGVDVDVRVGGRRLATLGPEARPGRLTQAFGIEGIEVARVPAGVALAAGAVVAGVAAALVWAARR